MNTLSTTEPTGAFPQGAELTALRKAVERACAGLRLPFRNRAWKGAAGNWAGVGIGSSIDFQDHRPYVPGDDPRYINWQAFARSGQYTMKLYREEVAPRVDLALDCSPSMFAWPDKAARTLELLYFTVESARSQGASLRVYTLHGEQVEPVATERVDAPDAAPYRPRSPQAEAMPDLARVQWRRGAMRVLVSDLLYPGAPEVALGILAYGGTGVVLAPWHRQEATPDWDGNLELIDAETGERRHQLIDQRLATRYRDAYQRHLAVWGEAARRHGITLARVSCGDELTTALLHEALTVGAVEQCR